MADDPTETERLVQAARLGDRQALSDLLSRHRARLLAVVRCRLDTRLRGRVDPSDVLQEALLVASNRLEDYSQQQSMSLFPWLRQLTIQKMIDVQRRHLGAKQRDVRQERSLAAPKSYSMTSAEMVACLAASDTSPSNAAVRAESRIELERALESMDPLDREVLGLRHFEELTNGETAEVLGIDKSAASKRYVRALQRLRELLSQSPYADPSV